MSKMEMEVLGMNFTCVLASFQHFHLPSQACILPLFSQLLGYAIVAASSVVKVPQIYRIIKSRSVKGLSLTAFELEVVGYTLALAFCIYKKLPFSAYGELSFLLIQALIIVGLIYNLTPKLGVGSWVRAAVYCAFAPTILAGGINPSLLEALYVCQHVIFILSRLPQIYKNYQSKQTGELSLLTSLMNFMGSLARVFTSLQAGAPINMVIGSGLGIITNGTLVLQIWSYRKVKSQ